MTSSSKSKFYSITWNDDFSQMMVNDNSAYWGGKLSYPMIIEIYRRLRALREPKSS